MPLDKNLLIVVDLVLIMGSAEVPTQVEKGVSIGKQAFVNGGAVGTGILASLTGDLVEKGIGILDPVGNLEVEIASRKGRGLGVEMVASTEMHIQTVMEVSEIIFRVETIGVYKVGNMMEDVDDLVIDL